MKKLIALLLIASPVFADDTDGGCYSNRDVTVQVEVDVKPLFNDADVTFQSGKRSITVKGDPAGGGRVSDSETGTLKDVGSFKIKDGKVKFKKEGTTKWKTLKECEEEDASGTDEGVGTLPSTAAPTLMPFFMHVPSVTGLDHPSPQQPPRLDDEPLPMI